MDDSHPPTLPSSASGEPARAAPRDAGAYRARLVELLHEQFTPAALQALAPGAYSEVEQRLWQEALVGRQTIFARRWDHGGLQTVAERITASQECRACRRAHWLNIELLEPHSGFSQLVNVGRLDVRAVKADVFPSEVIGHDVNDIRARR